MNHISKWLHLYSNEPHSLTWNWANAALFKFDTWNPGVYIYREIGEQAPLYILGFKGSNLKSHISKWLSINTWEQWEDGGTWAGALKTIYELKKNGPEDKWTDLFCLSVYIYLFSQLSLYIHLGLRCQIWKEYTSKLLFIHLGLRGQIEISYIK